MSLLLKSVDLSVKRPCSDSGGQDETDRFSILLPTPNFACSILCFWVLYVWWSQAKIKCKTNNFSYLFLIKKIEIRLASKICWWKSCFFSFSRQTKRDDFFTLFVIKMKTSGRKLLVKDLLLCRAVNYCCLPSTRNTEVLMSIKGPFLFLFGKISQTRNMFLL